MQHIRVSVCMPSTVSVCVCVYVCDTAAVCVSMTEGRREAAKCVCVSDRTRQLRGHGSSQLSAMSAVKSDSDGAPANHRVSLGAGEYRK